MDVSMIRRRVGAIWLPSTCCMERRVPWLRAKPTCRLSGAKLARAEADRRCWCELLDMHTGA
jgi:hypothetical protein